MGKAGKEHSSTNDQPGLEIQVLVASVLEKPRSWVIAHPEVELSPAQLESLQINFNRLKNGDPLPYLVGHWEFFGLDFYLSPAVLIPRPETELLVDEALRWLRECRTYVHAVDVGTGSGCIAISIARNYSAIDFIAIDISGSALEIAKRNVIRYRLKDKIEFLQADLIEPISSSYNLICANLPYIPSDKLRYLEVSHHEPIQALDGGVDGLIWINKLLSQATDKLTSTGLMLIEIEATQSENASVLAHDYFSSASISVLPDLSGKPRLLRIERHED